MTREEVLEVWLSQPVNISTLCEQFGISRSDLKKIVCLSQLNRLRRDQQLRAKILSSLSSIKGKINLNTLAKRHGMSYGKMKGLISREELKEEIKKLQRPDLEDSIRRDYLRGLNKSELRKRYSLTYYALNKILPDEERPELRPKIVPILLDHLKGLSVSEIEDKHDLDQLFIRKHIEKARRSDLLLSVEKYCIEGMSLEEVAKDLGVSKQAIGERLKRYGYTPKSCLHPMHPQADEITKKYKEGATLTALRIEYSLSDHILKKILKGSVRCKKFDSKHDGEIVRHYMDGLDCKSIAKIYNVGSNTIRRRLKSLGVVMRHVGFYIHTPLPMDEIRDLKSKGWSNPQLAQKYGVSIGTIYNRLSNPNDYSYKKPPQSELAQIQEAFMQGADLKEIKDRFGLQIKKMVDR